MSWQVRIPMLIMDMDEINLRNEGAKMVKLESDAVSPSYRFWQWRHQVLQTPHHCQVWCSVN